jgi:hypothetical protein
MACPFCNSQMKGRNLCKAHEAEVSLRAGSYNLTRSDALDQLWNIYREDLELEPTPRIQVTTLPRDAASR